MLDFGWSETFLILILALFLIGADDIPKVMVALGRVVRRFQYVKFALSQQFDDFMRDADLDDLRNSVNFEARKYEDAIAKGDFNESEADEAYILAHGDITPSPAQEIDAQAKAEEEGQKDA